VGQIVAFFVTQMVAVMFALLIIGLFLPPSPEAVEAAAGTLR
jgi:hypothetical protein